MSQIANFVSQPLGVFVVIVAFILQRASGSSRRDPERCPMPSVQSPHLSWFST
jgi:hypothetical protein